MLSAVGPSYFLELLFGAVQILLSVEWHNNVKNTEAGIRMMHLCNNNNNNNNNNNKSFISPADLRAEFTMKKSKENKRGLAAWSE